MLNSSFFCLLAPHLPLASLGPLVPSFQPFSCQDLHFPYPPVILSLYMYMTAKILALEESCLPSNFWTEAATHCWKRTRKPYKLVALKTHRLHRTGQCLAALLGCQAARSLFPRRAVLAAMFPHSQQKVGAPLMVWWDPLPLPPANLTHHTYSHLLSVVLEEVPSFCHSSLYLCSLSSLFLLF